MGRQKIELFEDKKGEFRWRLVSSRKVIATSGPEGYTKKSGCKQSIKSVTKAFTGSTDGVIPIVDLTVDVNRPAPKRRNGRA